MPNPILDEIIGLIGFVVEPHYDPDPELFEDGDIVMGCECSVLTQAISTPYLSVDLSEGELKAANLLGKIQFRSPFSIFS